MAGTYEPEEESSIDLVPEEKKIVNTDATVPRISNQLLNLFSWPATTDTQLKADTQPKGKKKILGFERHIVDPKIHHYHKSLHLPTTCRVTSLHKLRDVINDNNKGPYWLKFLLQAIAYNDATHKKAPNKIVTYKALARKCKEKVRLSTQCLVDSEERFIAKEIDNENLQTKLNNVQTQLVNICMQCEDNMANPTTTKYERFQ